MQEILHKSPYFQATSSKNVTDQMLQRVKKSRNPLYRKMQQSCISDIGIFLYRPFNYFKDTQQQMPQQPQYQVQQPPAFQQNQNPYSAERVSTSDSGNQNYETSSL